MSALRLFFQSPFGPFSSLLTENEKKTRHNGAKGAGKRAGASWIRPTTLPSLSLVSEFIHAKHNRTIELPNKQRQNYFTTGLISHTAATTAS